MPASAAATDPGFDAVESLYRGATGRSGLRSYEPALRPPEGTLDYGWLFRPDEPPAPPVPAAEPALTATTPGLRTTTSGLPAVGTVSWSPVTRTAGRRWPTAALLAAGLVCALLLPWAFPAL
ncbi:hypothetical protein GCM10009616_02130 [Microlunatus lacustris]